ncbi:MAG: hypothetical protein QXK35_06340 [Nitrososphaerales archaeon]
MSTRNEAHVHKQEELIKALNMGPSNEKDLAHKLGWSLKRVRTEIRKLVRDGDVMIGARRIKGYRWETVYYLRDQSLDVELGKYGDIYTSLPQQI